MTPDAPGLSPRRAFVLLGGLRVILRNSTYLTELRARGLKVLVLTAEEWRTETLRAMESQQKPGSLIDEAGFVRGEVAVEGGFTPGVIARLMEWRTRFEIVGVFAAGEMLVEQTGVVADLLGVPSPGLRATRVCRSKYLQRAYLPEWSPRVLVVPPGARGAQPPAEVTFPAVLKPSARRSSSGVRMIADARELTAALDSYPDGETLLVEEAVRGAEYSVEALVQDSRIVFHSVTEKRTNEDGTDRFVEMGHSVPAPEGPVSQELLAANKDIVDRLGFQDGIVHTELRKAEDGRVILMEVAARTPGDGILHLYHLATGRPMEPDILRTALGEPVERPEAFRRARQVYLETPQGVLQDVKVRHPQCEAPVWAADGEAWPPLRPGAPEDPPALRAVLVLKRRGDSIGPLTESGDRVVTFLIDAATTEELDAFEAEVRASIDVSVGGEGGTGSPGSATSTSRITPGR